MGLLGETPTARHLRPLSETRAIENGANSLAEGLPFVVAAGHIVGESWRSSRREARHRADVGEAPERLEVRLGELAARLESFTLNVLVLKVAGARSHLGSRSGDRAAGRLG